MSRKSKDIADLASVSQALTQAESFLDFDSESVTVQEAHHAMHILTFFLFMMNLMEKHLPVRKTLVDRVIYHLLNLREFIQDSRLGDQVTDLSASISLAYDDFFPQGVSESTHAYPVAQWLESHEHTIMDLARHYGKESVFQGLTRAA
ncbi:MAG: hypothetical protein KBC91_04580 [Candidatus Omnitrophica bacterium]|nr:hypothetical protein [Candidatus Omnitrophota bacterium]